jgi:hypothetical protein
MEVFEAGKYPADMGMLDVLKAEAERTGREASRLMPGDLLAIAQLQYQVARLLAVSPEVGVSKGKELGYIFELLEVANGIIDQRKDGVGEFLESVHFVISLPPTPQGQPLRQSCRAGAFDRCSR